MMGLYNTQVNNGELRMKSDKIVKLIADAFRVGRAEGLVVGHEDGYANGLDDGDGEGYDRGYEEGWDKGYEAAERDAADNAAEEDDGVCRCPQCTGIDEEEEQDGPEFEITLEEDDEEEDEEDDGECQCPSCTDPVAYDMGWNDGFVGETGLDEDMLKNAAYLAGYECGAADRKDPEREVH
jgi:hypothetical protein